MNAKEILIRFFRGIGAERDAEMYLRLFHRTDPKRFAVIEIEPGLSSFSLDILCFNLAFLSNIEIFPIVCHEENEMHDALVQGIKRHGGYAHGLEVDLDDQRPIKTEAIARVCTRKRIPVVEFEDLRVQPGETSAVGELVLRLKPKKYIRITEENGLRRTDDSLIDYVNLRKPEPYLGEGVSEEIHDRIESAARLLENLRPGTMLQITSANNLLGELFTRRGRGTLLKVGRKLEAFSSWQGLSRDRIRRLIARSFGRKLARGYFSGAFSRKYPLQSVILDSGYRGIAVIRSVKGYDYLDKFAVRPDAQGEGLANDLWESIVEERSAFFWRSRNENPINSWYLRRADGVVRHGQWRIWWKGMPEEEIPALIRIAVEIEETLE